MQGTSRPVLGSGEATLAAGLAVAAYVTGLILAVGFRARDPDPERFAVGGGTLYAVVGLGTWAAPRYAADAFVVSPAENPLGTLLLVGLTGAILWITGAVATYAALRYRLRSGWVVLFGTAALTAMYFQGINGEAAAILFYIILVGPILLGASVAVPLAELGIRRVLTVDGRAE
ncbi:hypothetical protein [Halomicrobium salinisoli]|uniref:hypothetical protein n=1 Tax=Halomicrobium salinisoli TaxID=2878391 RepID=UPI001CF030E7|nr:hypothetical protein [Halomicrobium salinisoli]